MLALTGDLVVPTLVAGDRTVVGFDAEALAEIISRHTHTTEPAEFGHAAAPQPAADVAGNPREADQNDTVDGTSAAGPPGNSLETDQGERVITSGATLADDLHNLLGRIGAEVDYNIAKGASQFRFGMHDGLRFAQDAVADLLSRHGHSADFEPRAWDF